MSELTVHDLTVARGGRTVVRNANITVNSGEVVALLGPNGAGRSSTILAMCGLLPVTGGTVSVDGKVLTGLRPDQVRRSGVSTVLENHRVLADLTVLDNLKVAGGRKGAERRRRIDTVLETFPELVAHLERPAGQLSGGQQQMLALGQALANQPSFLLIDEMSMGLAPVVVSRLLAALRTLAADGIGVLLVEQFAHLALSISDRAHVMARGQLVFSGAAGELDRDPDLLHRLYMGAGVDESLDLPSEAG